MNFYQPKLWPHCFLSEKFHPKKCKTLGLINPVLGKFWVKLKFWPPIISSGRNLELSFWKTAALCTAFFLCFFYVTVWEPCLSICLKFPAALIELNNEWQNSVFTSYTTEWTDMFWVYFLNYLAAPLFQLLIDHGLRSIIKHFLQLKLHFSIFSFFRQHRKTT